MENVTPRLTKISAVAMVFGLPLLGALLARRPASEFFRFPPSPEIPSDYLRFSWATAAAVLTLLAATLGPWFTHRRGAAQTHKAESERKRRRRFPGWGAAAVIWTVIWWWLAWTRWPWFGAWQHYTFFPLWIGFVVAVNALTHARTGSCLMLRAPARWLALFGAGAICWWAFEWLNGFVQNWHYLNAEGFGAVAYALHATLCFSTVLPALAAVAEWLDSHAGWRRVTSDGPRWRWMAGNGAACCLILGGAIALVGAGAFPHWFYPALWVGPLALFLAESGILGRHGLADEIAVGDWRRAATWMIAALICGFFWELWNWHSLAKWIYTVPGVERWHLFEMPALGYAGYLPFGLEGLLIAEWVIGGAWRARQASCPV